MAPWYIHSIKTTMPSKHYSKFSSTVYWKCCPYVL